MYAQLATSGARGLIFGLSLHLLPCFMNANSEGLGETVRMHMLPWTRLCGCTRLSEPLLITITIITKNPVRWTRGTRVQAGIMAPIGDYYAK